MSQTIDQEQRAAALKAALRVLSDSSREFDGVELLSVAMWIYDGKDPYPPTSRPNPFPDAAEWVAGDRP